MNDLTDRQRKILKNIIEDYIETAEPVGSVNLDKKYNLGVSPATLRNEMAALIKMGYLKQPHTSSGRVPTPLALKYYVTNLMQAKDLSVTDEVKIKEKVWDYKKEFEKALHEATRELAERTKSLALSSGSDGDIFYSGTANILSQPEFFDIDLTRNVLTLLDHFEYLDQIFQRAVGRDLQILLADELGFDNLTSCAVVFTRFGEGTAHQGVIGIIGPCRLNYQRLIPTVRYVGSLMDQLTAEW